jgi:type III secretory pathway component EscV
MINKTNMTNNSNELGLTGILMLVMGLIDKIPAWLQLLLMLVGIIIAGISATINVLNYIDRKKQEKQQK